MKAKEKLIVGKGKGEIIGKPINLDEFLYKLPVPITKTKIGLQIFRQSGRGRSSCCCCCCCCCSSSSSCKDKKGKIREPEPPISKTQPVVINHFDAKPSVYLSAYDPRYIVHVEALIEWNVSGPSDCNVNIEARTQLLQGKRGGHFPTWKPVLKGLDLIDSAIFSYPPNFNPLNPSSPVIGAKIQFRLVVVDKNRKAKAISAPDPPLHTIPGATP
jgi:hypothetical protein